MMDRIKKCVIFLYLYWDIEENVLDDEIKLDKKNIYEKRGLKFKL